MWGILLDYEANVLNRSTRNQETYSRKVAENGSMGRCLWRPEGWQRVDHVSVQFSSVQSPSHIWLFATLWTASCQASLSTNTQSLLKLMSIELVMPSKHLISAIPFSSCLKSCPASGSFQMSQLFAAGGQSTAISASASVHSMNIYDWFPLGWTGWTSLLSKGLSRVLSNTTVQKHQFFSAQLSL